MGRFQDSRFQSPGMSSLHLGWVESGETLHSKGRAGFKSRRLSHPEHVTARLCGQGCYWLTAGRFFALGLRHSGKAGTDIYIVYIHSLIGDKGLKPCTILGLVYLCIYKVCTWKCPRTSVRRHRVKLIKWSPVHSQSFCSSMQKEQT